MITYTLENFLGVFDNIVSPEYCKTVINHYGKMEAMNKTRNRQQLEGIGSTLKDTHTYFLLDDLDSEVIHSNGLIASEFAQAVLKANEIYASQYGILNAVANYKISETVKIQKTEPCGGYHMWHCEQCAVAYGRRVLQAILYLNDVEEGGETEFLYLSKRIKPKAGTLLLFPASFTHTHRGNPPLKGSKYLLNTWLEFSQ
jgi:hypothetical protein